MEFYRNLYLGESIKKPDKIRRKLQKYAKLNNVYVILTMEGSGRIEILHCLMLQQYFYRENPFCVIGIAGSRDEAADIIRRIAEEAAAQTGKADLYAYLFPQAADGTASPDRKGNG